MIAAAELRGVTKRYGDVTAVRNVTLSAPKGKILGILGPSGAGKSTVLRLMDVLEPVDGGEVYVLGKKSVPGQKAAHSLRRNIGMVLQKPVVLNRSVAHNLAYSLQIRSWSDDAVSSKVDHELKKLGLEDRRNKNARVLSGGEMQRLSFARATIYGPEILLLDEFTANLDPRNVALIEDMVRQYLTENPSRAVVVVTHNVFQAKRMCDMIALMWDGEVIEIADKHKFFENPDDERTEAFVRGDLVY